MASQGSELHARNQSNKDIGVIQVDTGTILSVREGAVFGSPVQADPGAGEHIIESGADWRKDILTSPEDEDMSTPISKGPLLRDSSFTEDTSGAKQDVGYLPEREVLSNEHSARSIWTQPDAARSKETIILSTDVPMTPNQAAPEEQKPAEARDTTDLHYSPTHPPSTMKDSPPPTSSLPTVDLAVTRPTSVPNFPSNTLTMQQGGPSFVPYYPDQTFEAIQSPQHPPPRPSRMPRTRSSHSSGLTHTLSSLNDHAAKNAAHPYSGSRTVGNTPAQSPGLHSPTFSSRQKVQDTDDGRPSSQILHNAHLEEPKETHILRKDFDPMTGRKVLNNYELFEKLGSGQHGTVKLGRNLETSEYVAVKIVRRFSKKLRLGKAGNPKDTIKKEVAILKKARHPHVVSLFEVIDDDEYDKVYLVLEFVKRGEIVWRKTTDKAIAHFEMDRLGRERTNGFDELFENQAIKDFNAGIPTRRLERARRLEEQKRQARERMASGRPQSRYPGTDPFWSLEYGGEADVNYAAPIRYETHGASTRLSRADIHAAEHSGESPHSATPVCTPNLISQALHSDFSTSQPSSQPTSTPSSIPPSQPTSQPASQPASRPETPSLDGTMYGPYVENKSKSDAELQLMLDRVIAEQSEQWSPEEEEHRYVPCLTLAQAREAFRDTVLGLGFLHYQGIIHRDIKPANLLWTSDYRVKISDFGVSYLGKPIREDSNHEEIPEADAEKMDEALELAKTVGTPAFFAPELCDPQYFEVGKNPGRPDITGQIDVWALGVTLYGMVFGCLPFFDPNEFRMYEKIAHDKVFIPRRRLKGVEHTDQTPSNHDKRMDDVLAYEDIDDTLRDLLKKLLAKQPSQRISLKEVKHHPWVVSGIEDKESWLDETDPSRQSQGKKIEVSTQEIQDAVVGVTLVDRIKTGVQRLSSVLRGRSSRKRTDSNAKTSDSVGSSSMQKSREDRRASLRGDEQIFTALKASRDVAEHPLAQSLAASPEIKIGHSYFPQEGDDSRPQTGIDASNTSRPSISERSMSTADSMKTVKASDTISPRHSIFPTSRHLSNEDFSTATTTLVDPNNSSSSSLGGIFGSAGRRFVNSMRSRERGPTRQSPSQASRSSSVDTSTHTSAAEDYHASPSLGFSSVIAAGHVDLPPALRDEAEVGEYYLPNQSSAESFQRAQEINLRRHQAEYARREGGHRRSVSYAADIACPPSPDDETFYRHHQQRPASAAESSFAISSSSDQIVSGESTAHSRIPSVVSGASSLSATVEEDFHYASLALEKSVSPLTIGRRSVERPRSQPPDETLNPVPALTKAAAEEDAGYSPEGEQDSDSEDEGLAMSMG